MNKYQCFQCDTEFHQNAEVLCTECGSRLVKVMDYNVMKNTGIKLREADLEKVLLHKRFKDKFELQSFLNEELGISSPLEDTSEDGLVADYSFLTSLTEAECLEIYYLKVPFGEKTIFITEVALQNI